ncbi:hypothetical protein H2198_007078 [Neophaeococcomyces mojaviensis]|uniref:Uncharacterized protein n=1 Tax=Neophaeococcomyces mojaviensis TaxID=3383035 RepID=A0ACC3A1N7_9EURO|nr:hypothetical protein H2198_007078 [Knufia sp. JES_112]
MATATVHALSTGSLTLPERFFITPADAEARRTVPSLSFLVQHHAANGKTTRIVFDLGIRHPTTAYPEILQKHLSTRAPFSSEPDAVASLAKGGLTVDDIDYVIFSHVHYDHVGNPQVFINPRTKFIVGPGALDLLSGKTNLNIGSHSFFESDLLPLDRTIELPDISSHPRKPPQAEGLSSLNWISTLSPFPHTIDLFSDGAIHIISAPGHLPGHINLAIRILPTKYIILAGDACHDIRLFTGERDIATWVDDTGRHCCIHYDIPKAKETIGRLAEVQKVGMEVEGQDGRKEKAEVEVVFAHNWEWEEEAVRRGRFWPGQL